MVFVTLCPEGNLEGSLLPFWPFFPFKEGRGLPLALGVRESRCWSCAFATGLAEGSVLETWYYFCSTVVLYRRK